MKDIQLLISLLLIISAFFCGIYYERRALLVEKKEKEIPLSVNISPTKNTIGIIKSSDSIQILINGKELVGTGVVLEK